MQRNVVTVDRDSGELMPGALVWVPGRVRIKEGWFMGFQEAFEGVARDPDLAGQPTRVLLALLARLDWENYIAFSQTELAKTLGIRREAVNRAVALLRAKGLLEAGPSVGTTKTYKLNPAYAWRGSVSNLHKARRTQLTLAISNGRKGSNK